ncbi:hypothetical protein JL100_021370 [Skermanella mucosa]|uniref:hypothetical protein n=1 Tax=Skermanella mucosa TaxID=1789672 RepID=UPI00192CC5A9|nr:hypothetical protein [Skermanella mucosa]UEM19620.1 hypothetical protein JL100_021370 [Skermanella mucosa]
MNVTKVSMIAAVLATTLGSASIAVAQQSNSNETLMQERQGAMGNQQQPPKPADQSGNLSGAGSAESEAEAATGGGTGGGLQFGPKDADSGSLAAQRQGAIGTQQRPPEPTPQGGAKQ